MYQLGSNTNLTTNQKSALAYYIKLGKSIEPKFENKDLLKKFILRITDKYQENKDVHIWYTYLEMMLSLIKDKPWFKQILYWCCKEMLKSNKNKDKGTCKGLNKVLLLLGKPGIGKTGFIRIFINFIFTILHITYLLETTSIKHLILVVKKSESEYL